VEDAQGRCGLSVHSLRQSVAGGTQMKLCLSRAIFLADIRKHYVGSSRTQEESCPGRPLLMTGRSLSAAPRDLQATLDTLRTEHSRNA